MWWHFSWSIMLGLACCWRKSARSPSESPLWQVKNSLVSFLSRSDSDGTFPFELLVFLLRMINRISISRITDQCQSHPTANQPIHFWQIWLRQWKSSKKGWSRTCPKCPLEREQEEMLVALFRVFLSAAQAYYAFSQKVKLCRTKYSYKVIICWTFLWILECHSVILLNAGRVVDDFQLDHRRWMWLRDFLNFFKDFSQNLLQNLWRYFWKYKFSKMYRQKTRCVCRFLELLSDLKLR